METIENSIFAASPRSFFLEQNSSALSDFYQLPTSEYVHARREPQLSSIRNIDADLDAGLWEGMINEEVEDIIEQDEVNLKIDFLATIVKCLPQESIFLIQGIKEELKDIKAIFNLGVLVRIFKMNTITRSWANLDVSVIFVKVLKLVV